MGSYGLGIPFVILLLISGVRVFADDAPRFSPELLRPSQSSLDQLFLSRSARKMEELMAMRNCPPSSNLCKCGFNPGSLKKTTDHDLGQHVGPLTVVSEEEAEFLYKMMKVHTEIPFNYPWDGCYARALHMGILLERLGVISGKIWSAGNLKAKTKAGEVGWAYHVAPVILVDRGNGKPEPMVLDPSLHAGPANVTRWAGRHNATSTGYTNRFPYGPKSRTGNIIEIETGQTDYRQAEIEDAKRVMNRYRKKVEAGNNSSPTWLDQQLIKYGF